MKVYKNMARCRVCDTTIESQQVQEFETCSCGCIAISGGEEKLIRNTRSWGDLEELSEYFLTWQDVLDYKQGYKKLEQVATNARLTGHSFFVFDKEVYRICFDRAIQTGISVDDLPCLIKAQS